jgi:two-component system invasion response regulator UvrY
MITMSEPIKVGIVNDHTLIRVAMASMINNFDNCRICLQAGNSDELKSEFTSGNVPNILVLDLHTSEADGYEMAGWLQANFKNTHLIVMTTSDSDFIFRRLLQLGAKAILKKDIYPEELKLAMQTVLTEGYYYTNATTRKLLKILYKDETETLQAKEMLTEAELRFMKHCCTELTYKEIADKMGMPLRTVSNMRDNLFLKLDIKSRVGFLLYCVRNAIVSV